MGAIEVEPPESLYDEVKAEECVGEGGHFFVRAEDSLQTNDGTGFYVFCERCSIVGWEQPDEGDR